MFGNWELPPPQAPSSLPLGLCEQSASLSLQLPVQAGSERAWTFPGAWGPDQSSTTHDLTPASVHLEPNEEGEDESHQDEFPSHPKGIFQCCNLTSAFESAKARGACFHISGGLKCKENPNVDARLEESDFFGKVLCPPTCQYAIHGNHLRMYHWLSSLKSPSDTSFPKEYHSSGAVASHQPLKGQFRLHTGPFRQQFSTSSEGLIPLQALGTLSHYWMSDFACRYFARLINGAGLVCFLQQAIECP